MWIITYFYQSQGDYYGFISRNAILAVFVMQYIEYLNYFGFTKRSIQMFLEVFSEFKIDKSKLRKWSAEIKQDFVNRNNNFGSGNENSIDELSNYLIACMKSRFDNID